MILPIFGLLAFGYAATFTRVFGEAAATALASFVFYFAIPVLLFRSMATAELPDEIAWGYLGAFYGGSALAFGLGFALARATFGARSSARRSSASAPRSATRSCSACPWC